MAHIPSKLLPFHITSKGVVIKYKDLFKILDDDKVLRGKVFKDLSIIEIPKCVYQSIEEMEKTKTIFGIRTEGCSFVNVSFRLLEKDPTLIPTEE